MGPAISRRGFTSGLIATPITSTATTASEAHSADDTLIALGREFGAISRALDDATSQKPPKIGYEQRPHLSLLDDLQSRLGSLETAILAEDARTTADLLVKARVASWARLGDLDPTGEATMDQRMSLSVVRDLIRLHDPSLEKPGALEQLVQEMTGERG